MGKKKYFTEEERKAAKSERNKKYYQANKEKLYEKRAGYFAEYYQSNKEKIAKRNAEYYSTPFGRADILLGRYKSNDKEHNRGECTLTAEWIIQNIFSEPCHYCGKTDWHELGCDRIDNSLPHTPDNVVPCCAECNKKRGSRTYDEYMRLISEFADRLNADGVLTSMVV